MKPIAGKKYQNLQEFTSIYPEFSFIFIGDNGQGDVRAAEMMNVKSSGSKVSLTRVYIHAVQPLEKTYCKDSEFCSRECKFICYFDNYLDAALDAYAHNLIKLSGLRRIASEATEDFKEIKDWHQDELALRSFKDSLSLNTNGNFTNKREQRVFELNRSLRFVNQRLAAGSIHVLPPVSELEYSPLCPIGTLVQTPFGRGVVMKFRNACGIYEILLCMGFTLPPCGGPKCLPFGRPRFQSAYLQSSCLAQITRAESKDSRLLMLVSTKFGFGLLQKRKQNKKSSFVTVHSFWGSIMYLKSSEIVALFEVRVD